MVVDISGEADQDMVLARVYQALGEPTRLRIVRLLAEHRELACGEMIERLGVNCSTLSHHLALLHEAGLVGRQKRGTFRIYRLHREALDRFAPAVADAAVGLASSAATLPVVSCESSASMLTADG